MLALALLGVASVAFGAVLGLYPQYHSVGVYVDASNAEKAAVTSVRHFKASPYRFKASPHGFELILIYKYLYNMEH